MTITVKKSPAWAPGQGMSLSGTGPGMVVPSTGGGGGSLDPTGVSGLKLRYNVLSSYSNFTWDGSTETMQPTAAPGSQAAHVHTGGGWQMRSTAFGSEPNFNGYGSVYTGQANEAPNTFYNGYWDDIYYLNIPGGRSARTMYLVGMFSSIPSGEKEMLGYGNNYKGWFGFSIVNGRIAVRNWSATGQVQPALSGNPVYDSLDASSKSTAEITAGAPFVVSYSYAEGTNLNANDIYLNGVAGAYGSGISLPAFGLVHGEYDKINMTGVVGSNARLSFSHYTNVGGTLTHDKTPYYVADALIFDSAHDTTTRQGIESWLMSRYGISA